MKHLVDPTPLISPEQAESDRVAFLASSEEWRKKNNRERTRKAAAKKRARIVNGRVQLTIAQVVEIRERCAGPEKQKDIAAEFGVSVAQVSKIANGKAWTVGLQEAA